jgi:glyoxylase-like metal-dependent hydrolase (beta-lactamase superfamily II)
MTAPGPRLRRVIEEAAPGIAVVRDTCNVYVIRRGEDALVVDFGAGRVLDLLPELGVRRITDVLLTHHHRDQAQGLERAVAAGIRIWAPPFDAELVADVEQHWQSRPLDADYDLREDRFSLLANVPVTGTVAEYRTQRFGEVDVYTLPTPGHTFGSVTYIVENEGARVAFVGDLLYEGGRVWSLAATQWSYSGIEGLESTIISLEQLDRQRVDLVLPSHGDAIVDPEAVATTRRRIARLTALRAGDDWGLEERLRRPFEEITPHLWRNRTTFASSYMLFSENGRALGIDFGYDQAAFRRPLVWSLAGVEVDAVIVTHYHDDHVAGLNLLREARGTEVWAPAHVAPILEEPHRYDLPCLWPEAIPVDRILQLEEPFAWNEYELTVYPLPGHTLFAGAVFFEVDGLRVLATGDQWGRAGTRTTLNYQHRNRFRRRDFIQTAELARRLRPDLLISGHWVPHHLDEAFFDEIEHDARELAELHDELLPEDGLGDGGFAARLEPYRSTVAPGEEYELTAIVRNPFARPETAHLRLVLPAGWQVAELTQELDLDAHGEGTAVFRVRAGTEPVRRARVAVDLTVGEAPFGQQAESLADVE